MTIPARSRRARAGSKPAIAPASGQTSPSRLPITFTSRPEAASSLTIRPRPSARPGKKQQEATSERELPAGSSGIAGRPKLPRLRRDHGAGRCSCARGHRTFELLSRVLLALQIVRYNHAANMSRGNPFRPRLRQGTGHQEDSQMTSKKKPSSKGAQAAARVQPLLKVMFEVPKQGKIVSVPFFFDAAKRDIYADFGFEQYRSPSVAGLEQKIKAAIKNGATPDAEWTPMIEASISTKWGRSYPK